MCRYGNIDVGVKLLPSFGFSNFFVSEFVAVLQMCVCFAYRVKGKWMIWERRVKMRALVC